MSTMIFLEPIDCWSFRDGKPFEAGEAFDATSLFPPSPWTTAGCIRTTLLRKYCPDPEKYSGRVNRNCPKCGHGPCAAEAIVGRAGESAPFVIGPPLLARRNETVGFELFYPAPGDLALEKEEGKPQEVRLLAPLNLPPGVSSSLRGLLPVGLAAKGRLFPFPPRHIATSALASYLDGAAPSGNFLVTTRCFG
jgi:CRISPR type III-B/RAMP module-associated protein Cmr3